MLYHALVSVWRATEVGSTIPQEWNIVAQLRLSRGKFEFLWQIVNCVTILTHQKLRSETSHADSPLNSAYIVKISSCRIKVEF